MSDELTWKRRTEDEDNWRPRSDATEATYVVYVMPDYGHLTHGVLLSDKGPDLEIFVGQGSIDAVKTLLQTHHQKACRAKRWADYMRDNEPPSRQEVQP